MLYIPNLDHNQEAHSRQYCVKVNGKVCPVLSCRVSGIPFNTVWPGHQRDIAQSELASYVYFFGDEAVTLEVTCERPLAKDAVVRPLSKGVSVEQQGASAKFTLKGNGNFVFENGDFHFALHIFYSPMKPWPQKDEVTYYFGPGVHEVPVLELKSNQTAFIHPEAMVYTTVYASGAENIRVFGGGVLNNSRQERKDSRCLGDFPIGNIRMYHCKNIRIEDVILQDSANWICALFHCRDVSIDNIKEVGQWRYNTDGIDLTNTCGVTVKDTFIRSFDDSICVKATNNFDVCEDIWVENCVCWCDWGKTLELGLETAAETYRNIAFQNCDLIHNKTAGIAISNGHYADIHDITYEDIRMEYQGYARPAVYQHTDDMEYVDSGITDVPALIRLVNRKFTEEYGDTGIADERDKLYGRIHHITMKNIQAYTDGQVDIDKIAVVLQSQSEDAPITDVTMENVGINGELLDDLHRILLIQKHTNNVVYGGKKL